MKFTFFSKLSTNVEVENKVVNTVLIEKNEMVLQDCRRYKCKQSGKQKVTDRDLSAIHRCCNIDLYNNVYDSARALFLSTETNIQQCHIKNRKHAHMGFGSVNTCVISMCQKH